MSTTVLKTKSSQLRATMNYKKNHPDRINNYMVGYYELHKIEILRKKKEKYHADKAKKILAIPSEETST
jgi:hypothetical protein